MSDLHLESQGYHFPLRPRAPILLLVGDVGRICDFHGYSNFIQQCCAAFQTVLLVAGNHEFYGSTYEEGIRLMEVIVDDPTIQGRFVFLNRTAYDIPHSDVTILGCTLHSRIGQETSLLTNDFRRIRQWTVDRHNAEHAQDIAWLRDQVMSIKKSRRILIATHYAPTFDGTSHPSHRQSGLNQCFASNAFEFVTQGLKPSGVTHWVYGHTHWNAQTQRGQTRLMSNQAKNKSDDLSWWQRQTLYRRFKDNALLVL